MFYYIIRRILYAIPVLIGVNILTFSLFFLVNSPDDMARAHLGQKHLHESDIARWRASHGYDKPLFINTDASGVAKFTATIFFQKSVKLLVFDFGSSDAGRDISSDVYQRMWPSLMIAVPVLILGLWVDICFALFMIYFRYTKIDLMAIVFCIVLMSISSLFYIIGGQYLVGILLRLVPISGYDDGIHAFKFIILPILVAIVAGLGSSSRWYRAIFMEEINRDYVRTARAKGLSESRVLFHHVLRNAMIPILTGVVVIIPSLFMGSLILESFFGIPGLGSYTIDAITQQDFAVVRAMVYLGSVLYILGLIMTDISYTVFDPRVRME